MGYMLPYKGHTVSDYWIATKKTLTPIDRIYINKAIHGIKTIWETQIFSYMKATLDISKVKYGKKHSLEMRKQLIRDYAQAALYFINENLKGIERFDNPAMPKLHLTAHVLFCLANNIFPYSIPEFTLFTSNPMIQRFALSAGELSISIKFFADRKADTYIMGIPAVFLQYLENMLGFKIEWASLEMADWLRKKIPEIKEKTVLEIGSGSGYMAQLLSLRGVNIKATDIKLEHPTFVFVEEISASKAIAKYKDLKPIVIALNPNWDIKKEIYQMLRTPNISTFAILSPNRKTELTLNPESYEISEHQLEIQPSNWKVGDPRINKYLIVIRKKKQGSSKANNQEKRKEKEKEKEKTVNRKTHKHQEL